MASRSSRRCPARGQRAGRLQLHWDASAAVQADYFLEKGDLNSTPNYYQNASLNGLDINGFTYFSNPKGANKVTYRPVDLPLSKAKYAGQGLTLNWDVNDSLTLKSLSGYRTIDSHFFQDYAEVFTFAPLSPFGFHSEDRVKAHQFSQELQFIGHAWNDSLQYVAGLYYFKEGGSGFKRSSFPDFLSESTTLLDADTTSRAAYGQLTWIPNILEQRLELTAGARYTKEKALRGKASRRPMARSSKPAPPAEPSPT